MPLQSVAQTLDPEQFVVVPHVAVLDTFQMTNQDGSFAANITEAFIDKLIEHMNAREAETGDLCPLVIGHTVDGLLETEQPPVVGYARNWHKGLLGSTGRVCAFCDFWILKDRVEQAKQYPRRSAECWSSRYEIDPISLLGATTPARDLGLMKLSREGSLTYVSPGDTVMPDEKDKKDKKDEGQPKADPKETGAAKEKDGKLDQILALLTQLAEQLGGGSGAPAGAASAAGPASAAGGDGQMSDDEYNQLLQELMQEGGEGGAGAAEPDKSRAGEKPTQNAGGACYPGGANTTVPGHSEEKAKMSRVEQALAETQAELARMQIKAALSETGSATDDALIADLVAMPPDMRNRQLDRVKQLSRSSASFHLDRAVDSAAPRGGKRMDKETAMKLSRKATEERKTFEQVAREEGYTL